MVVRRPARRSPTFVETEWKDQGQQLPQTMTLEGSPKLTKAQFRDRHRRGSVQFLGTSWRSSWRATVIGSIFTISCLSMGLLLSFKGSLNVSNGHLFSSVPRSRSELSARKRGPISALAAKSFVMLNRNGTNPKANRPLQLPAKLGSAQRREAMRLDHGGLIIRFPEYDDDEEGRQQQQHKRQIYHNLGADIGHELIFNGPEDDDYIEFYYAFDDDAEKNPYNGYDDDSIANEKKCRRTSWHRTLPINCNMLHEFDVLRQFRSGDAKFVGQGAFRQVFLTKPIPGSNASYAYKGYRFDEDIAYDAFEYMRMDALVAERFASNPRIVNLYGFCGTGMINEAMAFGDVAKLAVPDDGRIEKALDDQADLDVRNDLSASRKLKYALDMTEAVALLHSFPDGVIVHDDIQLVQFLVTEDKTTLKLNDFNRAEIMLFNEKDQEYCKYRNDPGHGDWRAPEEYHDYPLNEQIDIWSLGNNFYSLLTGLYPFYTTHSTTRIKEKIKNKKTGYIDPRYHNRSFAESVLAEVIPQCWKYDPAERIDIFKLLKILRKAVQKDSVATVSKT